MLKLTTAFCVLQACLAYYVPLSIEFMGNKGHLLSYDLERKADQVPEAGFLNKTLFQ
jgi:hypothetical protein